MQSFHPFRLWAVTGSVLIFVTLTLNTASGPSHRDDFTMNFIGGGEFRQYIMDHTKGPDRWSQTMVTFGTTHNLMHELMSDMARHGVATYGHKDRVPDFAIRISGGQWSTISTKCCIGWNTTTAPSPTPAQLPSAAVNPNISPVWCARGRHDRFQALARASR